MVMDGGTEAGLAAEGEAPQGGIGAITLRRAPVGVEESVVRVYCGISVWAGTGARIRRRVGGVSSASTRQAWVTSSPTPSTARVSKSVGKVH
jgi:hypothetical protein